MQLSDCAGSPKHQSTSTRPSQVKEDMVLNADIDYISITSRSCTINKPNSQISTLYLEQHIRTSTYEKASQYRHSTQLPQ